MQVWHLAAAKNICMQIPFSRFMLVWPTYSGLESSMLTVVFFFRSLKWNKQWVLINIAFKILLTFMTTNMY